MRLGLAGIVRGRTPIRWRSRVGPGSKDSGSGQRMLGNRLNLDVAGHHRPVTGARAGLIRGAGDNGCTVAVARSRPTVCRGRVANLWPTGTTQAQPTPRGLPEPGGSLPAAARR